MLAIRAGRSDGVRAACSHELGSGEESWVSKCGASSLQGEATGTFEEKESAMVPYAQKAWQAAASSTRVSSRERHSVFASSSAASESLDRFDAAHDPNDNVYLVHLERAISETLTLEAPYGHYFRDVAFVVVEEKVRLTGRVPSFYLKSVLQSRLQHALKGWEIENLVRVVSSSGLSSTDSDDSALQDSAVPAVSSNHFDFHSA